LPEPTPEPTAVLPTATHVPSTAAATPVPTDTPVRTAIPTPTSAPEPTATVGASTTVGPAEQGEDLRITIVYDNNSYDPRLTAEWGFSALIEYREQTLLFDTGGNGQTLLNNMEILGIDPGSIEVVVLSHIHGDHVDGLGSLLATGVQPTIYVPPSFPSSLKDWMGTRTDVVEVAPGQVVAEGMLTTGEMLTGTVPEQALVVQTEGGLVVVTGCAHPGIVEIVEQAKTIADGPVRLVVGGFHLLDKQERQIQAVLDAFQELGVQQVSPTHCTGEEAIAMFAEAYGDEYIQGGVGRVIVIQD
jgi:7,8-dihydropterin-6-yl-methyl-4-(beta-D-ribofuranosyl)aminobenzene 5'-phosphate synthase